MIRNITQKLIPSFYILVFLFLLFITLVCFGCTPKVTVYKGSNIISKQVFFKPDYGVAYFNFPDKLYYDNKTDLIAFTRKCDSPYEDILFISNDGFLKSSIHLNYDCLGKIIPVDIENDVIFEFYTFSRSTVILLDNHGQTIWKFSQSQFDNKFDTQIGIGDLDGDGVVEFVAAFLKGNDYTVHILDQKGNLKHHFVLPDFRFDFEYMKVFDTNSDGISEIVCNGMRGVHIFNSLGGLVRKFKPEWEGWHLSLWHTGNGKPLIYGPKGKSILLTDLTAMIVDEIRLSKKGLYFLRNPPIPIKFKGVNTESYIAATKVIPYVYDRSYFYIFNPSGNLIYEEVLPSRIDGYWVAFDSKIKKEYLIVSLHGTIWSYKFN